MDDRGSIGSVISLRSVSDAPNPRRKQDRRPASGNKKSRNGPSPYGTPSKKMAMVNKKTGREMLVSAIQGGGGLSTEGRMANTWQTGRPKNMKNRTTATDYLLEQLTTASGTRSVGGNARVGGKGPVYKDPESYYDEIQALKRTLKQVRTENALMKAKNGRMQDEIISKSKKIEELLCPDTQNNDLRRTMTSKNSNSSEVVMSLKRRIYRLEENLRSKESETRKMATEMKMTNFEELKLENEVFISEIQRLSSIVQELKNTGQNFISDQAIQDVMKNGNNNNKTQLLLKRLTDDNRNLVLENKSLKNDLMKLTSQTENTNLEKDYEDMNRVELLQKILSLEQKLKEEESRDRKSDKNYETEDTERETLDDRCIELKGPLPQQIKQLRAREKELLTDVEKLENTVKRLKEDRSHYRKMTDDYRKQLDDLAANKKDNGNESDTGSMKSERNTPRSSRKRSSVRKTSVRSVENGDKKEDEKRSMIQEKESVPQRKNLTNRKSSLGEKKLSIEKAEESEEPQDDFENAIVSVQSAWRAHNTRRGYINARAHDDNVKMGDEEEELGDRDVLLIQSAFRGHSTRNKFVRENKRKSSSTNERSRQKMIVSDDNDDDDDDDDEDDDVVIGSSASLSRFRESAKKQRNESVRSSKSRNPIIYSDPDRQDGWYGKEKKPANMSEFIGENDIVTEKKYRQRDSKDASLQRLKSSSSPWQRSLSNQNEDESEDEKPKRANRKIKQSKAERDHQELTKKWAKSGSIHQKANDDHLQRKIKMRKSRELLEAFQKTDEVNDDDEDDDDLLMSPSINRHRKIEKSALDDELF